MPLTVGAVRVALAAALLLLVVRFATGTRFVRLARVPLAVGARGVAGFGCVSSPPFTTTDSRWARSLHSALRLLSPDSAIGSSTAPSRTCMGNRYDARCGKRSVDGAELAWLTGAESLAMAAWLGAVPTALAYILFALGLRFLPASHVAALTLVKPVTAAALGALVLGERPAGRALVGITLVIVGLAVLARSGST